MFDAPSNPTWLMLTFDLDGTESDSLSIPVTAHILMEAVISLPWDVLQVPLAVSHLELQSLLGPMCLFHAGVVLVLVGEIIWVITQIGSAW